MMARRVCGSAMLYDSTTDIIQIQTLVQTSSSLQYPGPRLSTVLGLSLHVVDDFAAFECKGENGRDDALDIVSIPRPADSTTANGPACHYSVLGRSRLPC
jgi:hypothetical protein